MKKSYVERKVASSRERPTIVTCLEQSKSQLTMWGQKTLHQKQGETRTSSKLKRSHWEKERSTLIIQIQKMPIISCISAPASRNRSCPMPRLLPLPLPSLVHFVFLPPSFHFFQTACRSSATAAASSDTRWDWCTVWVGCFLQRLLTSPHLAGPPFAGTTPSPSSSIYGLLPGQPGTCHL